MALSHPMTAKNNEQMFHKLYTVPAKLKKNKPKHSSCFLFSHGVKQPFACSNWPFKWDLLLHNPRSTKEAEQ